MKISDLQACLPILSKSGVAAMIIGPHGIGKSEVIRQWAEGEGYKLVDLRLGTQDVGDLIGLACHVTDKQGNVVKTTFAPPDWLVETMEYCEENPQSKAVVFLDELNRAPRDVLQSIFQLVLDRKMHMTKLPENVVIFAAINPNSDDYIVTDLADKALISRFCHIKLSPTNKEWATHAKTCSIENSIIDFITERPEMLKTQAAEYSLDYVEPCNRNWFKVDALRKAGATALPETVQAELYGGLVSIPGATAYLTYLKNADKPLTAAMVLDEYKKVKEKVKVWSGQDIAHSENCRLDLITATTENVIEFLKQNKTLSKEQQKNLTTFFLDIPAEIMFKGLREIFPGIAEHQSWIAASKELTKRLAKAKGELVEAENKNK